MRGEWVYNKSYFSSTDCNRIIASALELPEEDPGMGYANDAYSSDFRRSKLRWLYQEDQRFRWIFDEFWKIATNFNRDWFKFNLHTLPPLQFTEYDESYLGEYKSHQDVFWINPTDRHRKLSLVLQLTDPTTYDGGDLVLEHLNEYPDPQEIRAQGTVIAFPSFVYHKLTPVTKGKRYSLIGWFEGNKFV